MVWMEDDFPFLPWVIFRFHPLIFRGVFFWCFLVVALNLSKRVVPIVVVRRCFFLCVCVHLYTLYHIVYTYDLQ